MTKQEFYKAVINEVLTGFDYVDACARVCDKEEISYNYNEHFRPTDRIGIIIQEAANNIALDSSNETFQNSEMQKKYYKGRKDALAQMLKTIAATF